MNWFQKSVMKTPTEQKKRRDDSPKNNNNKIKKTTKTKQKTLVDENILCNAMKELNPPK